MQNDWEIKTRSHVCSVTGEEFKKGEFFYTILYSETAGFRREDLCEKAWVARSVQDSPFSFWRSRYEPPASPPPEALNKKDGETLLRRFIAENNPAHTHLIYILALLLERKRLLRSVKSKDEDTLVYEYLRTGEVFLIRNPHLRLEQIPSVQREVSILLAQNNG